MNAFFLTLPFIAAMCYALGYVLVERSVGPSISPASYMVINTLAGVVFILALVLVKGEPLNFSGLSQGWPMFFTILIAAAAPSFGWVLSVYAIKNVSAIYTALGEASYPLFTLAFGFLLFGIKTVNLTTLMGGVLIMAGAVVMILGQQQSHDE